MCREDEQVEGDQQTATIRFCTRTGKGERLLSYQREWMERFGSLIRCAWQEVM